MKKILFMLLAVISLTSCSGSFYSFDTPTVWKSNHPVWGRDRYDAERRAASYNVATSIDNNGLRYSYSKYLNYTFAVYFGGYKVVNNNRFIDFYDGEQLIIKFDKTVPHTYRYDNLGGYRLIVDVTSSSAFVKVLCGHRILRSFKY